MGSGVGLGWPGASGQLPRSSKALRREASRASPAARWLCLPAAQGPAEHDARDRRPGQGADQPQGRGVWQASRAAELLLLLSPALLWPLPLQLAGVRRKRAAALPMRWRKAAAAALMNAGLPRASLSQVEHRRDAAHHRPVPATLPQGLGAEQARRGPPVRVTALGGRAPAGPAGPLPWTGSVRARERAAGRVCNSYPTPAGHRARVAAQSLAALGTAAQLGCGFSLLVSHILGWRGQEALRFVCPGLFAPPNGPRRHCSSMP